ncbi:Gfo/Idh/MocA family oxidoreductase [Kribbella sp. NBC_01245]|uniref:Gfo/Idh/MocA family protein n=1 Tax=Kribbella sp. NBC_01245 TaxID=2903578 RepID=UPI002E2B61A0|nr:Gfo/Idh/MocA family oxidoreductase [Kribbella sp. NBC_01245]
MSNAIRVVQVGAGAMGQAWLRAIDASPDVELAGLVDLDVEVARAAATPYDVPVAATLSQLDVPADAVVNVTVPPAHRPVSVEAMRLGLPVLCEKPIAPTVAEALEMIRVSAETGQLLMISQSRRYYNAFIEFRRLAGALGTIGLVSCEFLKAPRFGGFRDEMAEPLLVDMAIHQFDAARALLGEDPLSVYCESYNPPWSWYDGNAAANAVFEFASGARFVFNGSWCSPGLETSWNGSWRVSAEHGSATWDGDHALAVEGPIGGIELGDEPEELAGSLREFVHCLRTGETPGTEASRNVHSLAMVEAAVLSATERRRVVIAEILAAATA